MKLYPVPPYQSCGVTVVSILTGEPLGKVRKRIIKIRKKFPRDYDGYQCPKSKISLSTEWTYLSEIKRALESKKIKLKKFRRFNGRVKAFASKYPKGLYLLNFRKHVAVYRDGFIHDNGPFIARPHNFRLFYDIIESFAGIKRIYK